MKTGFFKISLLVTVFVVSVIHVKSHAQSLAQTETIGSSQEGESTGELVILAPKYRSPGDFSLGMRSTLSLFGSDASSYGSGVGSQFRIRPSFRLNTEWFADYITSNISDAGRRVDGHIGWSVMFYPFESILSIPFERRLIPYILVGHCFDYTRIEAFSTDFKNYSDQKAERWSSAIQMGLGTHFTFFDRLDFSLSAQYMLHLGNDIHAELIEDNGVETLTIESHEGAGVEGHILVSFSLNYIIGKLWQE